MEKGNRLKDELGIYNLHINQLKLSYQTKSSIKAYMLIDCKNINADHIPRETEINWKQIKKKCQHFQGH